MATDLFNFRALAEKGPIPIGLAAERLSQMHVGAATGRLQRVIAALAIQARRLSRPGWSDPGRQSRVVRNLSKRRRHRALLLEQEQEQAVECEH